MSASTTPAHPADMPVSEDLLEVLFNVSMTGVILFRPVFAADEVEIVDLAYVRLNAAAQQMLRLPERPAQSFLTLYPNARPTGVFNFYCQAYQSTTSTQYQLNYQHNGLDAYFHLAAQRSGPLLVVSFTDTNDQPRSVVEEALRESQAAEKAARAEAEAQRQRFYEALMALPAQVATYHGPNHVYNFVNAAYQRYFPTPNLLGRPLREVLPEAEGQGVLALMSQVYQTGEPSYQQELEIRLDFDGSGQPQQLFLNLLFQPLRDAQGRVDGLLDFSYDVTEQVRARQQVQVLNEELAAINEELRASNEEYLLANTALSETQQQLRQLNQELEARVQQRTQETLAMQAELLAGAQRQAREREAFYQVFEQVPVVVALLRGPEHFFHYRNPAF